MKARSFEDYLERATPPPPDPEAQLQAKRAALAEFERIHARIQDASRSEGSSETANVPARAGWRFRKTLWGAVATACVVVVVVSAVWWVPPEQRHILTHGPALSGQGQVAEQPKSLSEVVVVTGSRRERDDVKTQSAADSAVPAPSLPQEQKSHSLEEVVVTGVPLKKRSFSAPSPVTAIQGASGNLVSRSSPAAEASAPAPRAAAPDSQDTFEHFEINPVKRVADEPVSTFSVDVDTSSYSFARRRLNEGALPPVDAVRVEEMINYFDYAWPTSDSREQPFKATVAVSDSPWGAGKKLLHIGIKGYELPARARPDVNLVLLLDVSGSMDEPDKLPLAQQSMAMLLEALKPTDTVAIVVYAGAAGEVLAPTPVADKEKILRALNSLQPGGSTAGAAGIRLAYGLAERNLRKDGVNRILLATDGDFNVGITDRNELKGFVEREREKGVFLSVLGFGEDNYRDDMAQTLAQNGNGVAAYIDTLNEARKVLVQESSAALFTIAKDVKLQVEFNPATVAEYRLIGYETRALNREDFNNDKVDAGDVGAGHTVTAIYEITPVGSSARLIDDLRYPEAARAGVDLRSKGGEYGFLKIRYKLPDSSRSRLIEQPIRIDARVPEALKQDVEFSTAVAGFGQLLRGGKYTGPLTFDDVYKQARSGLGEDSYGYRAEFLELVRKAQHAQRP
ncbi:MAG TPA: VWA domain-containing protein [Steroidobacteraceae bacterium]|jgi:Ca-activated chloride channel family protein